MRDEECCLIRLEEFGAVRVTGADAVAFLQGQLSSDVARLDARRALLAGYHNPQGRVLALLRLVELAPGDVLAILPRELAAATAGRLARFVLRARVRVADESGRWQVAGLLAAPAAPARTAHTGTLVAALPATPGEAARIGETVAVRLVGDPARWLIASAGEHAAPLLAAGGGTPAAWRRSAIGAGEPQVYAATSGAFLAQMLNLDLIGAIDFDKGCYTGQEVIARTHWRGRVKRRMQRFASDAPAPDPGASLRLADGRNARVVDAAARDGGGCEFLAVVPEAAAPEAGVPRTAEAAEDDTGPPAGAAPIDATPLPLPYALPGPGAPAGGATRA